MKCFIRRNFRKRDLSPVHISCLNQYLQCLYGPCNFVGNSENWVLAKFIFQDSYFCEFVKVYVLNSLSLFIFNEWSFEQVISLIFGLTKTSPNKAGQKQVFRKTQNPWSSHSKNYIQMKENLKNMTIKKCSFPTYLVPPFRRTISQVSQSTFRIL